MRKLPYLNGTKAFEASARTGSFAKAAEELNVTPAAISRMVHLLEDRLGVVLFERKANRLAPTPAGQMYQAGLTQIFDSMAYLTAQVMEMGSSGALTVGVGPTFAIRWLIPRLADFQKKEPEIDVHFVTGGEAAPFSDTWTCGIKLGDGNWPGLVAERMFAADLVPICSPTIAKKLKKPDDIRDYALLRVAHSPDDWPMWFRATGVAKLPANGPEFDYYGQAMQAAADGVGVALGIRPYIDEDLRTGRLVTPFALSVPKGHWYLVYREFRKDEPGFGAFRKWIMRASKAVKS